MSWFDKIFKRKKDDDNPYEELVYSGDDQYPIIQPEDGEFVLVFKPTSEMVVDGPIVEEIPKAQEEPVVDTIKPLDLMKVNFVKAENQSSRRDEVRGICLHHIMMGTFKQNEDFLTSKASGVSAHYVLGRNAELTQMVNTKNKAWHAGVSSYVIGGEERENLNNCLIGIEIVNPGYVTQNRKSGRFWYNCGGEIIEWKGETPKIATIKYPNGKTLSGHYVPYPDKQIKKLVALCKALVQKYPAITRDDIVAHYQISEPLGRKNDPFGLDIEYIKDLIFS